MNILLKPTTFLLVTCIYLLLTLKAYSQEESQYPKVSEKLMQVEITSVDGNTFKLADLKGKVILVNLWATWAAPCRAQMPLLVDLQKQYDRKNFEVIGVNLGDGAGVPEKTRDIKLFAGNIKVNYTLVTMSIDAFKAFESTTKAGVVPQTILIDRQGHLRAVFVGAGPRLDESMKASVEKVIKGN